MEGNDFNLIPARAPVVSEEALKENAASSRIITVTADQAADILSSTKHPLNLAYHWVYAAPDQWVEGKNSAGRSTRHQLIPDNQKGPIVFEDELANHLDSKDSVKGDKLVYEVWVDDFGTHETNAQVGRKRMFRLIRHQDMKNAPNIVVQFPGFAHTHRFHDTRWFLALIAQAAKIKNCNFLFMDPMGKGLPGYDGADNISNISSEDIISDTNASTVNALDAMTARYKLKKERLNIVPIGHSLGARLARAFAANLVKLNKEGNKTWLVPETH